MPCSWPTVYPRELATGKNASKRKIILAPLERLRVATVSCFTKNAQLFFKKHWNLCPVLFATVRTQNNGFHFSWVLTVFGILSVFVSSLTDVSQTELIKWSQQKAKLFPIGWCPRARVNNRHRPCGKASSQISSRSRRQSFTFHCVFVAQRSTGGGPRVDFLLTELSFENHTQPSRWRHTKARLTKLRPDSYRPRYSLLPLCVPQTRALWECEVGVSHTIPTVT